jgi:hypothetical protein
LIEVLPAKTHQKELRPRHVPPPWREARCYIIMPISRFEEWLRIVVGQRILYGDAVSVVKEPIATIVCRHRRREIGSGRFDVKHLSPAWVETGEVSIVI